MIEVAEPLGIPVVADLHENMGAALRAYRMSKSFWKRLVFGIAENYELGRSYERRFLPRCHAIIIATSEAGIDCREYRIDDGRIVVVSNTEDETTFGTDTQALDPGINEQYANRWVVSYVGGMGPHRIGVSTRRRRCRTSCFST